MFKIDDIANSLESYCLVKGLKVLSGGHLRIRTKVLYTDGSTIDLYIEDDGNYLNRIKVSDFGFTFAHLDENEVRPWKSIHRMAVLNDALAAYSVELEGDRLVAYLERIQDFPDAVLRLSQACLAASCMVFTKKAHSYVSFGSKVRNFLEKRRFTFRQDFKFLGPYGSDIRVDFRVFGNSTTSVLAISGANSASSHNQANELFSRWSDLKSARIADHFLTIHDESTANYRPSDLRRLKTVSKVLPLNESEEITYYLHNGG